MILAFTSFRMAMAFALLGGASASIADACPSSDEIDELRRQLAKQQAEIGQQQDQIDELRRMLGQQAHMLAAMQSVSPAQGTPSQPSAPVPEASAGAKSPLSVGAGPLTIAPTGYLEYSQVWRSKNVDSGLPTNFAAVPFADTVDGHRRQTLASSAYTRLGLQINGSFSSLRLLG